jgi:hypothetical protein
MVFLVFLLTGCLPMTVNRTKDEPSTCPVHHIAMAEEKVEVGGIGREGYDVALPYARYRALGGCIPPQPMWARVYVCPQCERAYLEKHGRNPVE